MQISLNRHRLLLLIILLGGFTSWAQPGALDTTFNGTGIVVQDIAGKNDYGFATAVQADGKILVGGFGNIDTIRDNDFVVARYKTNGQLDSSFGTNGLVFTDIFGGSGDHCMSVCVQPDGKIVAGGRAAAAGSFYDFAVVRYNTDGSLDNSFGTDGIVTTDIAGYNDYGSSVKLQSDGKIVMVGYTYNGSTTGLAFARYNTDGTPDATFDGDGIAVVQRGDVYLDGQALAIQEDGKLVAIATTKLPPNEYDILVVRLNTNGSTDNTFDGDGILTTDFCYHDDALAVAIQNDGKIIVAGSSYDTVNIAMGKNIMLIRYNTDGTIDSGFGINGKVVTEATNQADKAYAVAIQQNGRIVTVGQSADGVSNFRIILTRYNSNGNLDSTFGLNGIVATNIASVHEFGEAVALQADGKIVATGFINNGSNFNMFVARYLGDEPSGIAGHMLDSDELLVYPNPCTDILYIDAPGGFKNANAAIFDLTGRKIATFNELNGRTVKLYPTHLVSGNYLLIITEEDGHVTSRVISAGR